MKKSLLMLLALVPGMIYSQFTLMTWDFSQEEPNALPTVFINPDDEGNAITTTAESEIQFKNGFEDKAAQASGWDNGANEKYWMVHFTTNPYADIRISSRQQSGGQDPGPRDWKVEYRIGEDGAWNYVPESAYQIANDWETGYIHELELPQECSFQEQVYIRWIVTSDTSTAGEITQANGKSKIDNIVVTAYGINDIEEGDGPEPLAAWPNPATDKVFIDGSFAGNTFQVVDMIGKVWVNGVLGEEPVVDVSNLPVGAYILVLQDGLTVRTGKVLVGDEL
jgi:hypothetical protein